MKPDRKLTGLFKWSFISACVFSPVLVPASVTSYISSFFGVVNGNVAGWVGTGIAVTVVGAISRIRMNRKWLSARHFDDDDPTTADPHLYNKGDSRGDKVRAFMPEEKIPDWWSEPIKYLLAPWQRLTAEMDSDTGLVTFPWRPVNYLAKDHAGKCSPIPKGYTISGQAGAALNARYNKITAYRRKSDDARFIIFYRSLMRSEVTITGAPPIDPVAKQYRNAATSFNSMAASIQKLTRAVKDTGNTSDLQITENVVKAIKPVVLDLIAESRQPCKCVGAEGLKVPGAIKAPAALDEEE